MAISGTETTNLWATQSWDGSPERLETFGPINLVVLQPTSYCNLNCDYCYLPDRQIKNQMSLDLIEPIFRQIFTSPFFRKDITVCWHAGEPLAVGVDFYEQAIAQIHQAEVEYKEQPYPVHHSVQTNGILINQAWCDLFQRHNFHVGVSIDGPAFIHDLHRQTLTGQGSHRGTMAGIAQLQKNHIPFNVIAVITQDSLDYADELFSFFVEHGITDVGFNMEETEGVHRQSSLDHADIEERYRAFMERFWQLTVASPGVIQVREFEILCRLIYHGDRLTQTDMNHPFVIVSIDHQGNFSTFDPELLAVSSDRYGDFTLGNVQRDSFAAVCETEKFQAIYGDMLAGVTQCAQDCQYFGLCGGGAGSNKYWEKGTFACTETYACRYRVQVLTDIVLEHLENSLAHLS